MEFSEAINLVKDAITEIEGKDYDGIIVKILGATNTLDSDKSSHQTHIAITGEQIDIFPFLNASGYFEPNYDSKDDSLKSFFYCRFLSDYIERMLKICIAVIVNQICLNYRIHNI